MKNLITSVTSLRKTATMGFAVAALAASISVVSAQPIRESNSDPEFGPYDGTYESPAVKAAPSRDDRANFDRSGTRGRTGLGANPENPEGSGDVSD